MNQIFIKVSKIVIVVFAIVDQQSFNEIEFWINYVKEVLGKEKYILALVAKKSDLYEEQVISDDAIIKITKEYKIKFVINSAFTNADGFRLFVNELIKDYIELIRVDGVKELNFKLIKEEVDDNNTNNINKDVKKRKCC